MKCDTGSGISIPPRQQSRDGRNHGIEPEEAVTNISAKADVTIYTITLGPVSQSRVRAITESTGDSHYDAAKPSELKTIFLKIANNLVTMTTQWYA